MWPKPVTDLVSFQGNLRRKIFACPISARASSQASLVSSNFDGFILCFVFSTFTVFGFEWAKPFPQRQPRPWGVTFCFLSEMISKIPLDHVAFGWPTKGSFMLYTYFFSIPCGIKLVLVGS